MIFFFERVWKLILNPKSLSGASERHLHKYKIMPLVMMLKYRTIVFLEHMNYRKTLLFPSIYFHPNSFPEAPVWTMNHWILGIVGKKYSYELMMHSAFSQTSRFFQLFSWFQSNNGTYSYLKKPKNNYRSDHSRTHCGFFPLKIKNVGESVYM